MRESLEDGEVGVEGTIVADRENSGLIECPVETGLLVLGYELEDMSVTSLTVDTN